MEEIKRGFLRIVWDGIKTFFTTNIATKIVSILFAMLLWGFVLTSVNPERTKLIEDVRVSSVGDSDLATRNLVVRGNMSEILGTVDVRVITDVSHYFDVTADVITARINLGSVMGAGIVTVPITVDSLSRSTVTLEIDSLITKSVPISISYTGSLPTGYWTSGATLGQREIEVTGPEQDVSRVVSAVCEIPLENRTESYNRTFDLLLYDEDGNTVEINSAYSTTTPSVAVRMEVLRTKTVPVTAMSALAGLESIPDTHVFNGATCNPSSVQIAADESIIDSVSSLSVSTIDVSNRTDSFVTTASIVLPTGVTLVSASRSVDVTIDISERMHTYEDSTDAIELLGVNQRYNYRLSLSTVNYSVTLPIRFVPLIESGDIVFGFTVDVTDVPVGTVDLSLPVIPTITLSNRSGFTFVEVTDNGNGTFVFTLLGNDEDNAGVIIEITMIMSEYLTNVTVAW
ncbi:MAG: CdaR family protein [Clostridia bacterium]|nr:CdaR family protein [Clostridia bacterium]